MTCRVYVGNISWDVNTDQLRDHMEQVGHVTNVDIFEDLSGRSKGCGIVEYENPEDAERAIQELSDTVLNDRPLFVREDRENEKRFSTRSIYNNRGRAGGNSEGKGSPARERGRGDIRRLEEGDGRVVSVSNLPWKVSWQDLKDLFRVCGNVVRADVFCFPDGRSKGVGKVLFEDAEMARQACEKFDQYDFEGRRISVKTYRR